jgi:hypothetical protein
MERQDKMKQMPAISTRTAVTMPQTVWSRFLLSFDIIVGFLRENADLS